MVAGAVHATVRGMRLLIGALCSIALLFVAAPVAVNAATVGCGRVTTLVAPNAAGSLNNGDGWLIFAKPDGSSEKVILRSGSLTPVGGISGYICVGIDGVYFTGLLAPGTTGYIPEPANWVTGTGVYCGTVATNPYTSGQISGPRTLQLTGGLSAFGAGIFKVPSEIALPTVGSYLCARFEVGAPSVLATILRAGDPGYLAAGSLPSTSTAPDEGISVVVLAGLVFVAALTMSGLRRRRNATAPH
jgi:hypothetical protein